MLTAPNSFSIVLCSSWASSYSPCDPWLVGLTHVSNPERERSERGECCWSCSDLNIGHQIRGGKQQIHEVCFFSCRNPHSLVIQPQKEKETQIWVQFSSVQKRQRGGQPLGANPHSAFYWNPLPQVWAAFFVVLEACRNGEKEKGVGHWYEWVPISLYPEDGHHGSGNLCSLKVKIIF